MADPWSFVQPILQFVLMINNMVGTFLHNKEDCRIITEVLDRVRAVVEGLKQTPNIVEDNSMSDALSDALKGLEEALKRAMKRIDSCQKKNVVLSAIQVHDIANKLRRIHDDISQNLSVAAFAIGAYNTSMLAGIKENVAALRADIASNSSMLAIIMKIFAALPDGDLRQEVERLAQTYRNSIDFASYQNNKDKRETKKTEFARLEVEVGKNKVLADSKAPHASLSDGKAKSTSVESVIGQGVKKASSSVSKLVDKAHSVVVSPAPSQLQRVISVSEVPGEAGSYKVGSLSSETSKLFGVYAAGASFEPNKETIRCPVTLTNKTDHYVGIWVKPINEQFTRTTMIMEPHSSLVVPVTTKMHEPPQDTVKFEALMIVVQSKHDLAKLGSSIGGKLTMDSGFMARAKKLQAEVYRAMLTAVTCEPARYQQIISRSTKNMTLVTSIDVHPTKTWIVTTHKGGTVSIWDYQKQKCVIEMQVTKVPSNLARLIHKYYQYIKEKAAPHWLCSVKFIAQEKWLAVGDGDGYIYVYAYADTKLYEVKKFRAYHGKSVDSLAVHPSKPYLLSSSAFDGRIKHWDWSRKWEKIQEFDVTTFGFLKDGVRSLKFNPRDTNTFACVTYANRAKVGNIKSSSLTATMKGPFNADYFFAPSHQHLIVTLSSPNECTCVECTSPNFEIRDLETRKIVHTLGVNGHKTRRVASHPRLPIFATMLDDGTVCLWLWDGSTYSNEYNDANSYLGTTGCSGGLEKMVHIPDTGSSSHDMVFVTDTNDITRLIVTFESMIAIMEVNMPMENTR